MNDYFRKSFVTYINQLLRLVLVAGSNVVIARYLGPSGKGVLSLIMSFLATVLMLGMFGIDEANIYFTSSKKASHKNILANGLFHTLLISCICVSLFLIFAKWFVTNPLKSLDIKYFYIIVGLVPFYFLNQHAKSMLLGHRAIYRYNIFVIMQFVILLLVHLTLIPVLGLFGGVLAIIISTLTLTILGIIFVLKYGLSGSSVDIPLLRKSYKFGVKSQLGIIFSFLNQRLALFIVNYFLGPYHVGIYAIAVAVAELPWHLPSAVATILFPWIADMKREDATRFAAYILRNVIFVTAVIVVILAVIGRYVIIVLFGDAFRESTLLLYVLLPGILALGITRILGGYFQGIGRPELGTLMVSFSFVETIALDLLLIPRLGTLGAAIAASVSYITSAIVGLYIITRVGHIKLIDAVVPRWREITRLPEFFKLLRRRKP
jgi:O-antigen/teichoic acid export membrane protein